MFCQPTEICHHREHFCQEGPRKHLALTSLFPSLTTYVASFLPLIYGRKRCNEGQEGHKPRCFRQICYRRGCQCQEYPSDHPVFPLQSPLLPKCLTSTPPPDIEGAWGGVQGTLAKMRQYAKLSHQRRRRRQNGAERMPRASLAAPLIAKEGGKLLPPNVEEGKDP